MNDNNDTAKPDLLAKTVVTMAARQKCMIVTAESCTGGMVAAALTDIAGSSDALDRGLVTYSNEAKIALLRVKESTLEKYGAVSAETALEMVAGALENTPQGGVAIAITGIAGPGGGSDEKPVGLVHFACQRRNHKPRETRQIFTGNRADIRTQAACFALGMLEQALGDAGPDRSHI
ncbi:MAG: CinA family protein [Alphaproteobacteria bacterium]